MFARMLCGLGAAFLLSSAAAAQVVEDFEHNDEVRYTFELTAVDNFDVTAAGAHDGARGGTFLPILNPAFRLRSDVRTAPGNTYEWLVRNRGTLGGRSYFTVGALAGIGGWSGVFAPNTNQILLQNNTAAWGFLTAGTAAFVPLPDTWYRMRLVWAATGDMTLSILNEAGNTTLATTGPVVTGFLAPGGIAVRGFGTSAATLHDIDTFEQPCPLETFEHADEALYAQATAGDNMSFTAGAARNGSVGAEFTTGASGFRLRTDVTSGPGTTYEWFVRSRGGLSGRTYVGFGASAAGAFSGVFAPNTNEIVLQDNTAWGFLNVAAAPFVPAANTWYRMRLVWASNGDMTLSVLNEAGTSTLATTPTMSTGFVTSGGFAMRGFSTLAAVFLDVDSVLRHPAVDDLDHGNEALYVQATAGDNMTLNAAAAHISDFGAEFGSGASGFRLRSDVGTSPGNVYQWFVRTRVSAVAGRTYVGFGASAGGAFSGVFAPNTGTIIIQNNTGWGFTDVVSAPFVPAADTWYLMRLRWDGNGDMRLSILDEAGSALLAQTAVASTGYTTAGGLSMRGFSAVAGAVLDVDTARVHCDLGSGPPPPFNYCTAKTTSSGCVPAIGFSGTPTPAGNYTVTCTQVEVGQLGVLFYGTTGPAAIPFQGGFLCVNPPVIRLPVQNSGGAAACSGTYSQNMTGVITALPVGQMVNCQWWFRDPGAATGTGLSNANQFVTQ